MLDADSQITQEETIVAISTATGEGGIGIVRFSGNTAISIAKKLFRTPDGTARESFKSRHAYYGNIVNEAGEKIDEVLITLMASPKTYTREDMVEISCHGGSVVTRQILNLLLSLGARIAEPGEFSKRAFLNGRIDLVQAEAIIDLIRSKSEKGWRTAFSQLDGKLSERLAEIEADLISIVATLEVSIDFPDEELEIADDDSVKESLLSFGAKIEKLMGTYGAGRIYREGISVAIVGRPNVGKSSLMNALLERDRVIVTPHPGTTRDTVEETLQIDGVAVKIIDTAGVREALDPAERIGVERTMEAMATADITLLVFDGSQKLTKDDKNLLNAIKTEKSGFNIIYVINKSDRISTISIKDVEGATEEEIVRLSAKTGDGIEALRKKLSKIIEKNGESLEGGPLLTRERHLEQLQNMLVAVNQAITAFDDGLGREFIAGELAQATSALSRLTGKAFDNQALDKIFSEFCIGK